MTSRTVDAGRSKAKTSVAGGDAPSPSPAARLTEEERQELREIFDLARTDRQSDTLTITDMRNLMHDLRLKPTEEELEAIFEDARTTPAESGLLGSAPGGASPAARAITFEQFAALMARRVESDYTPSQLRSAFQLFETGDSGFVKTDVLVHALCTYGSETMSKGEAQRLVDMVDPHHTGKIDYVEFINTVSGEHNAKLWS